MRPSREISQRLMLLERAHQLRPYPHEQHGTLADGGSILDARSNDYLGLAAEPVSRETRSGLSGPEARLGAGAARLISGTTPEHVELERELAEWLQADATLLFSSAYAANIGVLASLGERGDVIFSDELNHASIIDGCRLSRAEVVVYPHLDLGALATVLEERRGGGGQRWVVTESYFGMDGNGPELGDLRQVCDAFSAGLIVDEAHALGVFGAEGRGLSLSAGITPDVLVGGFGKAFGAQGGFVAAPRVFIEWFWNRARPFVFSTASSPLLTGALRHRLLRVRGAEAERQTLRRHEVALERLLTSAGVALPRGRRGPIFPVFAGSEERALGVAEDLAARGVRVQAIRPPTVPAGTSRLRIIVRADMSEQDVDALGLAVVGALERRGLVGGVQDPGHAGTREGSGRVGPGTSRQGESTRPDTAGSGSGAGPRSSGEEDDVLRGEGSGAHHEGVTVPGSRRAAGAPERAGELAGEVGGAGVAGPAVAPDPPGAPASGEDKSTRAGAGQGLLGKAGGGPLADDLLVAQAEARREPDAAASQAGKVPGAAGVPGGAARLSPLRASGESAEPEQIDLSERIRRAQSRGTKELGLAPRTGPLALPRKLEGPGGLEVCSPSRAGGAQGAWSEDLTPGHVPSASGQPDARAVSPGPRWIVLGTGTGVGKTFVARGLVRVLARRGPVAGLKPIETGLARGALAGGDAGALQEASFHVKHPSPHPLYAFRDPVTPSLAARREKQPIDLERVRDWTSQTASEDGTSSPALVIETAGGVFSPLGPGLDNYRLALALGAAHWVLVAIDRLGVLNEVASALHAMAALGRTPDCVILSAPEEPDASTGTNLSELRAMGVTLPIVQLGRGDHEPLVELTASILSERATS